MGGVHDYNLLKLLNSFIVNNYILKIFLLLLKDIIQIQNKIIFIRYTFINVRAKIHEHVRTSVGGPAETNDILFELITLF